MVAWPNLNFFHFLGGIVLPLLGAVPDSAIIIVSGLGDDAQEKLSVGMGYENIMKPAKLLF